MYEDFSWAPIRPDHRRRNITASISVGLVLALAGGLFTVNTERALDYDDAQSSHTAAVKILDLQRTSALTQIDAAATSLATAKTTLALHVAEVPAADVRAALTTSIQALDDQINAAWAEVQEADAAALAPVRGDDLLSPGAGFRAATTAVSVHHFPVSSGLAAAIAALDAPSSSITTAVLTWQSDQAKAVADASAKASAAAKKAASNAVSAAKAKAGTPAKAATPAIPIIDQSHAPSSQAEAPVRPAVATGPFTLNVRVTGGQTEVDACNGAVDVAAYLVAVIAEHWYCGGSVFPQSAGTVITLTGIHAGRYRVEGVVATLNHDTAFGRDIPATYDLLFQTCQNNNDKTTSFTALTKIG
ncbi:MULTISPECIES: hypothetical protein [unclassified Cryobacterium]|uniref:hypothetical protein n=1 Tax=unclassified Cryobacterium TaxID=2649013 RepID=UPI002AB54AF8|nr:MULTISPECIES: hypothetical protein [unclassified Cryobacterium]MDY7543127.1 hypothetical protein [Cryobacterium sp. 5B3]MEA9998812.1 hypothetical protein [Cryobacterium sp. RTS3]MEB0265493.1 hypothetical protein [Cryobacterium sp. 10I5]MEB0275704.1 hypothetical protein [Cryobacterium sp. 5B3]